MATANSYSHFVAATVPRDSWDQAWFSYCNWKGLLQSFSGFLWSKMAARQMENGDVRVHIVTSWEYPEQLDEMMRSDLRADILLAQLDTPAYDVSHELMQEVG